jgi:hypothetical protein
MTLFKTCLLIALGWLAFLPSRAFAQSAGATLLIEARDPAGAAVADVVVTITDQHTGGERRLVIGKEGAPAALRLPSGTYTLSGTRDGFKTAIVRDVGVESAASGIVILLLTPGDYREEVVVVADATTLRPGTGAVGAVFGPDTMLALPVNDREALSFAVQAPGMAPPAPGSRLSTQGNTGVNSGGARESANNYLLDGIDNNDQFLNRMVINPSLDAIQEVAVLQNTYDAEYGRSAGAQLAMISKSGTRTLRGSAYEFFRDSGLDARNAFQPANEPKPILQRHEFGGTVGGPLPLRQSFYFASVEGIRGRDADTRRAHVPTAAERSGVFRTGAPIRDPFTGTAFPDGVIPASRMSPAGVAAANLYPLPNREDAQANFVSSPAGDRNAIQFTVKTDHTVWSGSPVTARYSFSRDNRHQPFPVRARNLPGFGISVLDQGHHLSFGLAKSLSPHAVNELRVGVNALRRENLPQSSGTDGFASLGIVGPPVTPEDLGFPTLVVSGFESLGDDPNLPVVRRTRTLHISDVIAFDRRKHYFKAGGEFRTYRSDGYNHLFARGQASFTGAFTGNPFADLLLGLPTVSLLGVNDNRQALRTWAVNGFVQDDWRVNWKLTVNAGVRYEYNAPPYDADNRMRILDLTTLQLRTVGSDGVSRSGLQGDFNNVAPRAGFSFDPTGYGRWLVRGGYGIYYDSGTLIENSALYFNPPYFSLRLFVPGAQLLRLENPFPSGGGIPLRPAINTLDPRIRTGYSQQASLGVERLVRGTTAAVRYVTSFGSNLVSKRNLNQPAPGPGPLDARRPISSLGDVLLVESAASSRYHSLQLSAVRPTSHRLSFRAAYTLSTSMDDASAFLATDGDDNTPQDSRNLGAEWGPSDFDVRHRMVVSGIYNLPAAGPPVFHNWQVSAVITAQSGRPFTPRISFDNSNTGNVGGGTFPFDRPNVTSGPLPAGARGGTYDGRTFIIAPQFTFGNAGRNSLTGPAYATVDAMIGRRATLSRRTALTLRVALFNALNRKNLQLPDSFVDRVTFGQSLAAYAPRQLQFSVRLSF